MMIYFYEPECFFISRGNAATCHCRIITAANVCKKKKQKIPKTNQPMAWLRADKPKQFMIYKKLTNYSKLG